MTTVAFRFDKKGGEMAADSSCIDGDTHYGGNKKVWRIGKCLIGFCGEISPSLSFVKWFKFGADDESVYPWGTDFDALVACPNGDLRLYDGRAMEPVLFSKREKYMAIGSGADVALGCMYQGGSAVEAVRAAIKFNTNTKGPVRAYRIRA